MTLKEKEMLWSKYYLAYSEDKLTNLFRFVGFIPNINEEKRVAILRKMLKYKSINDLKHYVSFKHKTKNEYINNIINHYDLFKEISRIELH